MPAEVEEEDGLERTLSTRKKRRRRMGKFPVGNEISMEKESLLADVAIIPVCFEMSRKTQGKPLLVHGGKQAHKYEPRPISIAK